MSSSILQQQYIEQVEKDNVSTIECIIDPRFHSIVTRSAALTRSNKIHQDTTKNTISSPTKSNIVTTSKTEKTNKLKRLSPTCKSRLQGLLIGLITTAITLIILLSVFLTRTSVSSTTSTSTISTCDTLSWNSTGITILGNGSNGTALNQLNTPWGVFIDVNDIIYIADSYNHRILNVTLMNNGSNTGTVIAGITNVLGNNATTLYRPSGIYIDSEKNLYISDTYNNRVQYYQYGSSNGSTVAGSSAGYAGITLDKLYNNYALYVDASKNIYILDGSNGRIVKWIPGASSGILIAGANGSTGYSSNQLAYPVGITVDTQKGIIYIADFFAQTIVAWTSYMTYGTIIIGTNSTYGNTVSLLNSPFGIIRDIYGNIYVSDYSDHRVQMYCSVGSSFTTGKTIAGIGLAQFSSIGLSGPTGIAFDSQMNLYVADANNHRIQKFNRIK